MRVVNVEKRLSVFLGKLCELKKELSDRFETSRRRFELDHRGGQPGNGGRLKYRA